MVIEEGRYPDSCGSGGEIVDDEGDENVPANFSRVKHGDIVAASLLTQLFEIGERPMPYEHRDGCLNIGPVQNADITTVMDASIPINAGDSFEVVSHWYSPKYLFERAPGPEDIAQGTIGDCFLLAALLSIVQQAPNELLNMMIDMHSQSVPAARRESGFVVVRVYHENAPIYYKLQKTRLTHINPNFPMKNHKAFWVHMIEKAFAVYTLLKRAGEKTFTHKTFPGGLRANAKLAQGDPKKAIAETMREALSGGQPHETFPVLLNWSGDRHYIDGALANSKISNNLMEIFRAKPDNIDADDTIGIAAGSTQERSWLQVFGPDWQLHYRQMANDYSAARFSAIVALISVDVSKQIRQESILAVLAQHPLAATVAQATRDQLRTFIVNNFPGKRGSARYTTEQLQIYQSIRDELQQGRAVQVSSRSAMGIKHVNNVAMGGTGEKIIGGLAGTHAYQVVRCESDPVDPAIRYVVIRNPWGKYARKYVPSGKVDPVTQRPVLSAVAMSQAEEATLGGGVSRVELSDFTKRFEAYSVSKQ